MLVCHLNFFFQKLLIQIPCSLLNLIGCFLLLLHLLSCWYVLYINRLPDTQLVNIFSCSVGCLFTLLVVSFAKQKLLSLTQSHVPSFAIVACTLATLLFTIPIMLYFEESSNFLPCLHLWRAGLRDLELGRPWLKYSCARLQTHWPVKTVSSYEKLSYVCLWGDACLCRISPRSARHITSHFQWMLILELSSGVLVYSKAVARECPLAYFPTSG